MSSPILHFGATVICDHAGPAQPATPFPRVSVSGQPVVSQASPYVVTGCGLSGSGSPPCATGQWVMAAVRVLVGGVPVLVQSGQAVCVPTGGGLTSLVVQPRVSAI